jgi:hypothetical protein
MTDEAKTGLTPADQLRRLEQLLDEGLDDLDAGRMVSRDQMRGEIETLLATRKAMTRKR